MRAIPILGFKLKHAETQTPRAATFAVDTHKKRNELFMGAVCARLPPPTRPSSNNL